eukprot:14639591-Alexandrium_andersonii.AAC.1
MPIGERVLQEVDAHGFVEPERLRESSGKPRLGHLPVGRTRRALEVVPDVVEDLLGGTAQP